MHGKLAAGLVTLGIAMSATPSAQAATPQSHADQQGQGIIAVLIGLHHRPAVAPRE